MGISAPGGISNSFGGGGASLTLTDGTHTVASVSTITVSGATVGGTTPSATLIPTAIPLTVTDGTHTVANVATLTAAGITTVSGTTPNATITTATPSPGQFVTTGLNVGSSVAFSNGNLTAAATGAPGAGHAYPVVVTVGHTTGNYYFEWLQTTSAGTNAGMGLANSVIIPTLDFFGVDTNSIGYFNTGQVYINSILLATIDSYTSGSHIQCAARLTDQLVFFKVDGGFWNASSSANPTTGVGGISLSTLTYGTGLLAGASLGDNTDGGTINLGASAFYGIVPTGFLIWND